MLVLLLIVVAETMLVGLEVVVLVLNFNVITPATEATMIATTRIAAETAVEIPFLFPSIVPTTFLLAILGRAASQLYHTKKGHKIKMKQ